MKSWRACLYLIAASGVAANGVSAQEWTAARTDGHAPIGVMGDHTHEAGEWMLSFRDMHRRVDGNRDGTQRLDTAAVLQNYPVTPRRMPMDMYMFGAMFAPSDHLTLLGAWIALVRVSVGIQGGLLKRVSEMRQNT
jgi:hypothetical protein